MFSRLAAAALILAMALGLVGSGCSIRENPAENAKFSVASEKLDCLDTAGTQVQAFFQGEASADDVDAIWNCASHALDEFKKKVIGADPNSYSTGELRRFLSKYFIHTVSLTPELSEQVGVLKVALVGGAPDRITRWEIDELEQIFQRLKSASQDLRPFMPLTRQSGDQRWTGIGGRSWTEIDSGYLDRFQSKLVTAAFGLGVQLQRDGSSYSFVQFDELLQAFLGALPTTGDYQATRNALTEVRAHLTQIRQIKGTLITQDPDLITTGADWIDLLTTSARWGALAVRLAWFADADRQAKTGEQVWIGAGLQNVRRLFDDFNGVLVDVVTRRPKQLIPFDELGKLIAVVPAENLPASLDSIQVSLKPAIQRLIGGMDPGLDGRMAQGITPGILAKLHDAFYNWYEGQRFLETLYQRLSEQYGGGPKADYVRDTLLRSEPALKLWGEVYEQNSAEWNSTTKLAARRIESLLRALRPLFMGSDAEISFPKYDADLRYSFHDLSELNWMQTMSRLMLRGYTQNAMSDAAVDDRSGAGVSYPEFKAFFDDFKPLGISLKLFDPDDPRAAFNRFREGDVFTYVSDGNGILDLNETTALLAFAISADRKAARIHSDIAAQCPVEPKPDKYGQPLINYKCYVDKIFSEMGRYWNIQTTDASGKPTVVVSDLMKYYNSLDPVRLVDFKKYLETSGRKKGYQPGVPVDSGDTQGFVAALQYIETIFTRYDTQDSGMLDASSAEAAFPVFRRTLEQMASCQDPPQTINDTTAELVFTYMLAHGVKPQDAWQVIRWAVQKALPIVGNFEADRIRILEIFASLSAPSSPALTDGSCGMSP